MTMKKDEQARKKKVEAPKPIALDDGVEISDKEMINLLVELKNTKFWTAIEKYSNMRSALVYGAIVSIDAFKEPNQVARNQGILTGMKDMIEFVELETIKRNKQNS